MRPSRVVVVGATGFIGSAVQSALRRLHVTTVGVARTLEGRAGYDLRSGDLTIPESLSQILDREDVIIHCAPYLGSDEKLSEAVNVRGTRNLAMAAGHAGAKGLIYVSTTAVYGYGPHRDASVGELAVRPLSARSRHRRHAEEIVLAAGGCVIRPHLVLGAGDNWVLPGLLHLTDAVGGLIEGGSAQSSAITVSVLARLVATLALSPKRPSSDCIFHAVHPNPLTMHSLVRMSLGAVGRSGSLDSVSIETATRLARAKGIESHHIDLATADHWYNGDTLWSRMPDAPTGNLRLEASDTHWYRQRFRPTNTGLRRVWCADSRFNISVRGIES